MNRIKKEAMLTKKIPLLFIVFLLITIHYSLSTASMKVGVVASVDNIAITLSEFEEAYSTALKATPGVTKEEVLNAVINRVLLLREAKKSRLEAASHDDLLKEYIDVKIRPFIKIKEETVQEFYQNHRADFQDKALEDVREEVENYLTESELNRLLNVHIVMFPIEMIGNFARVLSLGMRLFGNIFGEHTATGIFMGMLPFVIPWPMMGLGIFGATLQAFVFIMMTMVYIGRAVAEEH